MHDQNHQSHRTYQCAILLLPETSKLRTPRPSAQLKFPEVSENKHALPHPELNDPELRVCMVPPPPAELPPPEVDESRVLLPSATLADPDKVKFPETESNIGIISVSKCM